LLHALQRYTRSTMLDSDTDSTPLSERLGNPAAVAPLHPGDCGRRDRKKLATRQALRNAALQLVAERGFANVTVEDIAEGADVATRTFFNYFPSKDSAVVGADPERVEQMRLGLLARPSSESPLDALRAVLVGYAAAIAEELDDLGEGKDAWFSRLCVVRNDPGLLGAFSAHMAEVERGLTGALAERLGTDPLHDPYPATVAAAALAAARVAALYWSANGGVDSLALLTERAINSLAKGLAYDDAAPLAATESRGADGPGPANDPGHERERQAR
jgi:AcrR family transcriptional regulator